jgi:hypothetical protein
MSTSAQQNTNPDAYKHRLHSNGAMGFIESVYNTLGRLGRPYYFSSSPPRHFLANASTEDVSFEQLYGTRYADGEQPHSFVQTPHAIVHSYEQKPARMGARPSNRTSMMGAQRTPTASHSAARAVPSQGAQPDSKEVRPFYDRNLPPLWPNMEAVPDFLQDHIDGDHTRMTVAKWEYDCWVDFCLMATTDTWLEQMAHDLRYILKAFHHRYNTGDSPVTGWEGRDRPGCPGHLSDKLMPEYPCRTITWQLKFVQAVATPVGLLDEISVDIIGEPAI